MEARKSLNQTSYILHFNIVLIFNPSLTHKEILNITISLFNFNDVLVNQKQINHTKICSQH